jgi:hypothetical protein
MVTFGAAAERILKRMTLPNVRRFVTRTSRTVRGRNLAPLTSDVREYDRAVARTLRVLTVNGHPAPRQLTRMLDCASAGLTARRRKTVCRRENCGRKSTTESSRGAALDAAAGDGTNTPPTLATTTNSRPRTRRERVIS